MKCQRCDFRTDDEAEESPRTQLVGHAQDAAHPLCILGLHSLTPHETQTCEGCLSRTQGKLKRAVELYALLPVFLGHIGAQVYDRDRRGGSETQVVGGTVLVMLADGSPGAFGHAASEREDDPESAAYTLGTWEDDWRHTRGEPAATERATVVGAAGYLERRMRWAANQHHAFDEFAADVRRLVSRLESVTHTADRAVIAPATCFDCGGRLMRGWTEKGLEDDWHCESCGRTYTHEAYFLAVRAQLEAKRKVV